MSQETKDVAELVKAHSKRREARKVENERAMKRLHAAVPHASESLVASVNRDVLELFTNQHILETETKELQAQTDKFQKQSQQWLAMFETFNKSLKELGDLSNWANMIESDAREAVRALDTICKAQGVKR
eukprot:TRINITY_DN30431_c0_g1_i1.p3 TRINITY_DN30431_c0_g1~~TRINITY_DN30431_c0_g1_i1.p3  ORF type:complete len:130 (+),score=61.33 TRINITY_DN30431_c0_g1_i1:67-456(+)